MGAAAVTGRPHAKQKAAPTGNSVAQWLQLGVKPAPHFMQNRA
jgi:hypothetical protein